MPPRPRLGHCFVAKPHKRPPHFLEGRCAKTARIADSGGRKKHHLCYRFVVWEEFVYLLHRHYWVGIWLAQLAVRLIFFHFFAPRVVPPREIRLYSEGIRPFRICARLATCIYRSRSWLVFCSDGTVFLLHSLILFVAPVFRISANAMHLLCVPMLVFVQNLRTSRSPTKSTSSVVDRCRAVVAVAACEAYDD